MHILNWEEEAVIVEVFWLILLINFIFIFLFTEYKLVFMCLSAELFLSTMVNFYILCYGLGILHLSPVAQQNQQYNLPLHFFSYITWTFAVRSHLNSVCSQAWTWFDLCVEPLKCFCCAKMEARSFFKKKREPGQLRRIG